MELFRVAQQRWAAVDEAVAVLPEGWGLVVLAVSGRRLFAIFKRAGMNDRLLVLNQVVRSLYYETAGSIIHPDF